MIFVLLSSLFLKQICDMIRLFLVQLCLVFTMVSFSQKTYIWCGSLIDGVSADARKNMTIVVEGNKITSVEAGFLTGAAADRTIDLKTKTVTPGWIDMHVHMEHETNPNRYMETYTYNPADYAFQSVKFSEVTL